MAAPKKAYRLVKGSEMVVITRKCSARPLGVDGGGPGRLGAGLLLPAVLESESGRSWETTPTPAGLEWLGEEGAGSASAQKTGLTNRRAKRQANRRERKGL